MSEDLDTLETLQCSKRKTQYHRILHVCTDAAAKCGPNQPLHLLTEVEAETAAVTWAADQQRVQANSKDDERLKREAS